MAPFRFTLQQLLELRRMREHESARQVGLAQRHAQEAQRTISALDAVRRASADELLQAHGAACSAGELQRAHLLLEQLDDHIAEAGATLATAQDAVAERVQEYTSAARLRQVIDRLRDRQQHIWRAAAVRAEQRENDEIAVIRHINRQPDTAEA
jgi:flagellar export protein FliJ